jgi:hypothetical protein
MAWKLLKCIIKVYICMNKIQRWLKVTHAHNLVR